MIVLIKGAGDLASGVAHRLIKSGFFVVMTEIAQPTMVRRTVSFGEAIYESMVEIEGITAKRAACVDEARVIWEKKQIPVLIDPEAKCIQNIHPQVIVDAIVAKRNTGTHCSQAPLVIGLGPGFIAGEDVHLVVETQRGHDLGRVIENGAAEKNTGIPGEIGGHSIARLIKAPAAGFFWSKAAIGDRVISDQVLGTVGEVPVLAGIEGVLRGLVRDGLLVKQGMKIGDIDPRARVSHAFTISDKARAIAGGVLEGILSRADLAALTIRDE